VTDFVSGWRQDREDYKALAVNTMPGWQTACRNFAAPDEIDPRPFVVVENQGQQGACQGHALSSIVEHCYHIATGEPVQLSRQFAYIRTQFLDGISGDRGSTISGGARLAREFGIPREELWPYPGRYDTNPPRPMDELLADAERYKINGETPIKSYDEAFQFIAAGIGGITIGVPWFRSMSQCTGVMEGMSGPLQGWHAMAFLGYSKKQDSRDRNYLWLLNSHGTRWGNQGWAEVSPTVVGAMIGTNGSVFRGLSDMVGDAVKARPVDWVKDSYKRRKF
jgi:hypothetical protein